MLGAGWAEYHGTWAISCKTSHKIYVVVIPKWGLTGIGLVKPSFGMTQTTEWYYISFLSLCQPCLPLVWQWQRNYGLFLRDVTQMSGKCQGKPEQSCMILHSHCELLMPLSHVLDIANKRLHWLFNGRPCLLTVIVGRGIFYDIQVL